MKISLTSPKESNSCNIFKISLNGSSVYINLGLPFIEKDSARYHYTNFDEISVNHLAEKNYIPESSLFSETEESLNLLLSQPFYDYKGIMKSINPRINLYLGFSTALILDIISVFTPQKKNLEAKKIFSQFIPFNLNEFKITPFLNDRAGLDAYFFLIESKNKTVFYYGDFYGHRRRSSIIKWLKENFQKKVDALVIDCPIKIPEEKQKLSEKEIYDNLLMHFQEENKINFVHTSGFNLIRFISIYNAARDSGKILIVDLQVAYTLYVLAKENSKNKIPYPGKSENHSFFRVFFPVEISNKLIKNKNSKILYLFQQQRITNTEIEKNYQKIVMFVRAHMKFDLINIRSVISGNLIYSLGADLINEPYHHDFINYLLDRKFKFIQLNSSGHEELEALNDMLTTLKPKKVITLNDKFHNFDFLKRDYKLQNLLPDKEYSL